MYTLRVPGLATPDRIIVETPDVCVGEFRCPTTHPLFRNSGPSSHFCFAFPRTAVIIRHGNGRILADANLATLYNKGQEYERAAVSPRGDVCEWFGVSPQLLRGLLEARDRRAADDPRRPIRYTHAPVDPDLYMMQRRVYRRAVHGSVDRLWLEEAVVELTNRVFDAAYGTPAPPSAGGRTRELVHEARTLLAQTVTTPLALSDIANALGVSMFHLSRCFRAMTGHTLHEHRSQLRLRASLEGLERDDRDLVRVALDCGYSSHSHFTAAFRQAFGVPPSRIRSALRLRSK
jgi:AraC-like DNA-binding protein